MISRKKILSRIFGKNFVKVTVLLNKLHSVEKHTKMLSRRKNFRQTTQQKWAKSEFTNGWFLPLRGISGLLTLNELCRLVSILELIANKFLSKWTSFLEIFHAKNWSILKVNYSYGLQWSSGFSMGTITKDPPVLNVVQNPCANLREKLLSAFSHRGFM